jgi:hypothetical protein
MNIKRTVTLRLLQLIKDLTAKANELEGIGVKWVATDELIEEVGLTILQINGVHPESSGSLHLSLSDYCTGDIEEHDFMGLLSGVANSQIS